MTSTSDVPSAAREKARARVGPKNLRLLQAQALVFLAPSAIFAARAAGASALIFAVGCLASIYVIWRISPRDDSLLATPVAGTDLAGCLALGLALCLLGGEAHIFYANYDWLIRDAVLSDLVRYGFPVFYRIDGQDYFLRAPLGMYLTPALIGHFLDLEAAHLALLAQNSFLTATVLYFAAQLAKTRKFVVLTILIAFSGLDILPILFDRIVTLIRSGDLVLFSELEWWTPLLQYSSHITQLFWAPNHALPGWCFAALALLYVRSEIDISLPIVSFTVMLLWSPLAMMGAAPFLAYFGLPLLGRKLPPRFIFAAAAAALCFFPISVYLLSDAGAAPHRWMFGVEGFLAIYLIFLAIEIPHSVVLAIAWERVDASDRRLLMLATALLVAIPFYSVGTFNDFAMRASIVPLFLIAFAFARVASLTPRDNGAFATCISAIIIVSAATPLVEIKRSFSGSYAISDCNLASAVQRWDFSKTGPNYFAHVAMGGPSWLHPSGSDRVRVESRKCWPDQPLLEDEHK